MKRRDQIDGDGLEKTTEKEVIKESQQDRGNGKGDEGKGRCDPGHERQGV